jgi:hypothetical protein
MRIPLTLTVLLALPHALAADRFDVASGHGFDWTQPRSARCVKIEPKRAQALQPCEFHASGAFGLPLAYHACRGGGGGEVLVFRDARECREALDTMRANAP